MDQADCIREYTFNDHTGDARTVVYRVFPGVEAAFTAVHMAELDFGRAEREGWARIHFCREGRVEQELDREFFYLMPGDCSITLGPGSRGRCSLPLKHYHGVSIGIDPHFPGNPLTAYLEICGCAPVEALERLCGGRSHIILRGSDEAERFFEDLCRVPEEGRLDYLRVKLPELFFLLKRQGRRDREPVPRSQVELVRAVAGYITEHLNGPITLRDLSRTFGVSDTCLQKGFRRVYGMTVMSFVRSQKMQCAAQVLIHTTRTVDSIAGEFGYENESKFSAAFKRIMGDPPGVYRREHSKVEII